MLLNAVQDDIIFERNKIPLETGDLAAGLFYISIRIALWEDDITNNDHTCMHLVSAFTGFRSLEE